MVSATRAARRTPTQRVCSDPTCGRPIAARQAHALELTQAGGGRWHLCDADCLARLLKLSRLHNLEQAIPGALEGVES